MKKLTLIILLATLSTSFAQNTIIIQPNDPKIERLIELAKTKSQKSQIEVYSIQLYASEYPETIANIKNRYNSLFSEEIIEEVFEPPYFKAMTGAYLDQKMAEKKLSKIKSAFKSAFVLKRDISIAKFTEYRTSP